MGKLLPCLLISILGMQSVDHLAAFYALPPSHLAFTQRPSQLTQSKASDLPTASASHNAAPTPERAARLGGQAAPLGASANFDAPNSPAANNPTDAELSRALGDISAANPEFGLRRLASALRATHPHWRFHERRLRRLATRSSLAPPPPAPAAAAAAAAAGSAAAGTAASAAGAAPAARPSPRGWPPPGPPPGGPLFVGPVSGSVPNIGWRAVPMEHLRLHPLFAPL
jgi:hypothetical protein